MPPLDPPIENIESCAEAADAGVCPWCRNSIPQHTGAGRPRVWCSDQCRRDAHNARKAARTGAVGVKVIRQTRIVEKPVEVRMPAWQEPPLSVTPTQYLDDHDVVMHVLGSPELMAKILDSFSAGIAHRRTDREFKDQRLHEATLRLASYLDLYRHDTAPPPETTGLSRQQRRALERQQGKKTHR